MNQARKRNAQEIYDSLRDLIVSLRLVPGSRVTETQLAEYFQVSRTPVRAALQRLESEGYLTIKAKQGIFIRNLDMMRISQYYDVRVALENLVLTEIHQSKDKARLHALADTWHPETRTFGLTITDELKIAEENFHVELAHISNNSVLLNYLTDINNNIRVVRKLGWPNEKSVTDTYEEHYRICEYLLNGDLAQAREEMTNHIRKSQDTSSRITLHQLYGNRDVVSFDS